MPVYLFTFHAYKSWMPDHARGYLKRNRGAYATDEKMSRNYQTRSNHEAVTFTTEHQRIIIQTIRNICMKREWRLHYAVCVETHAHNLISWKDETLSCDDVIARVRQSCGYELAQHFKTKGKPYLSKYGGGDRKRVETRAHFEYLMTRYLPDHRGEAFNEHLRADIPTN